MYQIQNVKTKQVIPLRHKVLRPHQTIMDCYYPGDEDATTLHYAAINEQQQIIGIATVYLEKCDMFSQAAQYRLRGMATDENVRGTGVGVLIVKKILNDLHNQLIWCNARTTALGFYEKLGFKKVGDEFTIEGIGPHFVMAINHHL